MFVGETPFSADSILGTFKNIKNYAGQLVLPAESNASAAACDLVNRLCTADRKARLTYEQIMAHPFFNGLSWGGLRKSAFASRREPA